MPAGLVAHLRYPEDLFALQSQKYATYHMTEPHVFYNSEDLWQLPRGTAGDRSVPVAPYYVLIRMPGEPQLEFLLLTPLTPAKRDNMIAWLAARADPPHYGQLVVFKLPKDRLVLGPAQVEATIDQDTTISRQLTLWDQRGSRVIRGHLLVIPIDDAFIYVEPVYLRAEDNEIPQLQRVIVSDGARRGDGAHAAGGARGRVQRRSTRRGLQCWIGDRSARRRASVGSRCAGGSAAGAAQGRLGRVRQCDAAAERNPWGFIHSGRRLLIACCEMTLRGCGPMPV